MKAESLSAKKSSRFRPVLAGAGLFLALLFVFSLSLRQGSVQLSWSEFGSALLRQGDARYQTIVWDLRLPRVLAALLVGLALGLSGALLQGMLKNGLASPFLLGISAGSGLVAVAILGLGIWQIWLPLGAWLGGVLTIVLVYALADRLWKPKAPKSISSQSAAHLSDSRLLFSVSWNLELLV